MNAARILRAYGRIITNNIPLFLAVGLLNMLFSEQGWFPNETMNGFGNLLYQMMIPLFLAYSAGVRACGSAAGDTAVKSSRAEHMGGLAGVLAGGCLMAYRVPGTMLFAVLAGGLAGYAVGAFLRMGTPAWASGFEMIGRNLLVMAVGILTGGMLAALLQPVSNMMVQGMSWMLQTVFESRYLFLANLLIEPMKVLFLNNWMNHGILIPIGMEQLRLTGESMLFLMETNPGPGVGVLAAFWLTRRLKRKELTAGMAVEFFGGIHELYFPYVLSDLRLLAAVMAGGVCGSFCFHQLGVGLAGPVSPGSVLSILMMGQPGAWSGILLGIGASALVSGGIAWVILRSGRTAETQESQTQESQVQESQAQESQTQESQSPEQKLPEQKSDFTFPERIRFICVVCDAGLGSSAMGAALLRRQLKAAGIPGIQVQAAAADDIPKESDLLVCQRDFYERQLGRSVAVPCPVYRVEQLTGRDGYADLVEKIRGERHEQGDE